MKTERNTEIEPDPIERAGNANPCQAALNFDLSEVHADPETESAQDYQSKLSSAVIMLRVGEDAKAVSNLHGLLESNPEQSEAYLALVEHYAGKSNKEAFRKIVAGFVQHIGVSHDDWPKIRNLWQRTMYLSGGLSSADQTMASPGGSHRINLLRDIGGDAELGSCREVRLVSRSVYKKLSSEKHEERVAGRISELAPISHEKRLKAVDSSSIDRIRHLVEDQPNMSEAAEIMISHLHGQCLLGRPAKLPALLLAGPPGTGKTRFMRKAAEALSLPFCDIPLAGSCDSIKISGLSKYWGAADAGMLAETIANHDEANPIFMLDEIDKAGFSNHGNPLDTLLLLLEYETAIRFKDEFLGIPMNLGYSSVIATANSIDSLPPPLLSRFVVVEIPELSREGKMAMVRTVYRELLEQGDYGQILSEDVDPDVILHLADSGFSGRELKRAVETGILRLLSELPLHGIKPSNMKIKVSHLQDVASKSIANKMGFLN